MVEQNHRLQQVVIFVQKIKDIALKENPGHAISIHYRWNHTLRVTQYGKKLAEQEGANVELCMSACLLHDIAKISMKERNVDHGRVGAKTARPFLLEIGYSDQDVENMCFAIARHVDGKADFKHQLTPESKIVRDADDIDRFGAYRILLQFRNHIDDYEKLIARAKLRIKKIKKMRMNFSMETETGNKLFNRQLDLQIDFLDRLIADSQLTIIPEL